MKRVRREEHRILYDCGELLGRKIERPTDVLISYIEPENDAEGEYLQDLYRRARARHLPFLQDLVERLSILERCVDEFNKRQILLMDEKLRKALDRARWYIRFFMPKVIPSEVLNELLLPKQELARLRERVFDLLDVLFDEELELPVLERVYTTLLAIDFFVAHLNDVFMETHDWLTLLKGSKRQQLLNVSF